jgi:MarR family transcriptional regulator, organic hydroperoxide resistance regulator
MKRGRSGSALDPMDPVLDFLRLLWSIEHSLQRTSKSMHAVLGVTGPQRLVLLIVGRAPGISPGELARLVRLHPSTITGVLQRLERKRLLVRNQDRQDSRRVHLHTIGAGRALARRTAGTVEAAVARALRKVPSRDLRSARTVLTTIAAALDGGSRLPRRVKDAGHRER